MRPQDELIALYRHVLRAGDVTLARRLAAALLRDPAYRRRALAELRVVPWAGGSPHETPAGRLLDGLVDRLGEAAER
jgi:hypothetical protein